jgi:hypothetical protein
MQALTWPYFAYDCRLGGYSLPSRERPSVLVSRVSQARGHIVITLLDTREILEMSLGSRYGGISIYLFQAPLWKNVKSAMMAENSGTLRITCVAAPRPCTQHFSFISSRLQDIRLYAIYLRLVFEPPRNPFETIANALDDFG